MKILTRFKEYCLIFKPLSTITRLPDAQTIFGSICNILLNTKGDEAFNQYIDSFSNKPYFIHSSMFPLGMLPMVNKNIFSIDYISTNVLKQEVRNQLAYLQKMKELKKIMYMDYNIYNDYISNNNFDALQKDLVNGKLFFKENCLIKENEDNIYPMNLQLLTHVKKQGYYNNNDEANELYYDSAIYCHPSLKFCIFVKTENDIKEIKEIFKYARFFGFGSRSSVGKNCFELIDFQEINLKPSENHKLLLSKSSLDDSYKLNNSHYQIESKLYRPSKYYLNTKFIKRMNLFKEGSYLNVEEDKEWYGELLKFEVDGKPLYYYALGYVL